LTFRPPCLYKAARDFGFAPASTGVCVLIEPFDHEQTRTGEARTLTHPARAKSPSATKTGADP